jgi:hypothetical protein
MWEFQNQYDTIRAVDQISETIQYDSTNTIRAVDQISETILL